MLHRTASDAFFPKAIAAGVGTFVMHAVRSIFARPAQLAAAVRDLAAAGRVPAELATKENPLDFLVHPGGAESVTDAAYRFARYEPGVSVVLFGTGSADHLRENISSLARPPLPEADRTRLLDLFREVSGLGLENHGNRQKAA
jgi:aryl-alcohol dehydrogenase-like predicted oxidoreductase